MNEQDNFLIFIPAYNCAKQIPRVLRQLKGLPPHIRFSVLVLDNQSPDGTIEQAIEASRDLAIPAIIGRNRRNYGLGGSHKAAFTHAIAEGFTHVIVLHGDDQGNISDVIPHLEKGSHRQYDALLGARFMPGSRLQGYSGFRTFGNRVYNLAFSAVAGSRLFDLGSGLNVYRTSCLEKYDWRGFANDLTFNYYLILAGSHWRWKTAFFPISWREDDQVSNVKLFKQARQTARLLASFALNRARFLAREHVTNPPPDYGFDVVGRNAAKHD
ncbi:MAG: glycosyltransferase family 2 protein [Rubrivivax sp.]|nr:MAG: glycosyltransferase family 2 protein [Rubrivivax sp.]